jgi:hypothetical protein
MDRSVLMLVPRRRVLVSRVVEEEAGVLHVNQARSIGGTEVLLGEDLVRRTRGNDRS